MKVTILVENTPLHDGIGAEHGLCVYLETKLHKILVDTGASDLFLENARKLGINLEAVDTLVLSHGHYDHCGGVMYFSGINHNADIYLQKSGMGAFYHGEKYIGIDPTIGNLPQIHLLDGDIEIDSELSIFTNITGRRLWPDSNHELSERIYYNVIQSNGLNYQEIQDEFQHEQCLVIQYDIQNVAEIQSNAKDEAASNVDSANIANNNLKDKTSTSHATRSILISGCAHNGILNILDKYKELYNSEPDYVISGFHMKKKTEYTAKEIQAIESTARELLKYKTVFYTGHCTGNAAFAIMKTIMGEQLQMLHSGDIYELT